MIMNFFFRVNSKINHPPVAIAKSKSTVLKERVRRWVMEIPISINSMMRTAG